VAIQEGFAGRGERVLLVAKKILSAEDLDVVDTGQLENCQAELIRDLFFVGLVSLADPPRHDTSETVRVCRAAGVRFFMVTGKNVLNDLHWITYVYPSLPQKGDFAFTATAIARQVGIITTPPSELHTVKDLPVEKPLDEIPEYDASKAPGDALKSIALSGLELTSLTPSQWKGILTVKLFFRLVAPVLNVFYPFSMMRSCSREQVRNRSYKSCVLSSWQVPQ
jgi:sodium/potassium-transporting ATPase subunit alpha